VNRLFAPIALALCLALAACGGSSAGTDTTAGTTAAAPAAGSGAVSTDLSEKPVPVVPDAPADKLQVEDIVEGEGPAAKKGDKLTVQYVGVSQSSGQEFDSSWSRGKAPFELELGAGMVIPGWDQGLVGMKAGGRRQITIPGDLAYGPGGQPAAGIGPDDTLVFVVDLEKIN
jgi:peptidylprolyl isomerase